VLGEHFVLSNSQVSVPLFTAGRIHNAVNAAEATAEATRTNETTTTQDLKLNVVEAYVSVLRAARLVEVAVSNVASLEAHQKDVDNLFEQGIVPKNDVLAVAATLADARQHELQARNALDIARAAYNRLLGRALTEPVTIDDLAPQPVSETLDALTDQAIRSRTELAGISHQADALRYQAGAVQASRLPQIAFQGGEIYLQNPLLRNDSFWFAGVGLKWDIFDFGEKKNQALALKDQAEASTRLRSDAISTIRLQVRKAWLDVDETQKRIEVARTSLDQAEENLKVAKDRYTEGVGTNTEVLDAEALRTRSQSNYATALYDAVLAVMELRRAVGTL